MKKCERSHGDAAAFDSPDADSSAGRLWITRGHLSCDPRPGEMVLNNEDCQTIRSTEKVFETNHSRSAALRTYQIQAGCMRRVYPSPFSGRDLVLRCDRGD